MEIVEFSILTYLLVSLLALPPFVSIGAGTAGLTLVGLWFPGEEFETLGSRAIAKAGAEASLNLTNV